MEIESARSERERERERRVKERKKSERKVIQQACCTYVCFITSSD